LNDAEPLEGHTLQCGDGGLSIKKQRGKERKIQLSKTWESGVRRKNFEDHCKKVRKGPRENKGEGDWFQKESVTGLET